MAPPHRHAVQEDHRHGVLQHREGQRAEEDHGHEQHPADDIAMFEKARELRDHRARLARHQPLHVARQRGEQFALVDDVRQRDDDEDEQRHHRQQRVVRHRPGEQQPLVGTKAAQHLQRKGEWVLGDVGGRLGKLAHGGCSPQSSLTLPAAMVRPQVARSRCTVGAKASAP